MNIRDIEALLTEIDYPCLSIIFPAGSEGITSRGISTEVVQKVEDLLEKFRIAENCKESIFKRLEHFSHEPLPTDSGTGIYISPGRTERITFPFPVVRKVAIDQHFESEELLKLKDYLSEPATT